jgi:DNA uptake protein ComE-like DNA-binding protein
MYDTGTTARIVDGKIILLSGDEVRAQTPPKAETAVPRVVSAREVTNASGVPHLVDALEIAGFVTAISIRDASDAELTAVSGIGKATAVKLKTAAANLLGEELPE